MKFEDMKNMLSSLMKSDYKNFVKAFLSLEAGITEKNMLEDVYNEWFSGEDGNDNKLRDILFFRKPELINVEKDENIKSDITIKKSEQANDDEQLKVSGIVIKDPTENIFLRRGEEARAISFAIASEGTIYNCVAYDAYISQCDNFKKGDTISLSGFHRINQGKDDKVYHNISIRSAQMIQKKEIIQIHSGRVYGDPRPFTFQNERGQVEVLNFTLLKKEEGKNQYIHCSLYSNDMDMFADIKPGKAVTVMGKVRQNTGKDGVIYHNFICDKIDMLDKEKGEGALSIADRLKKARSSKEKIEKSEKPTGKNVPDLEK